MKVSSVYFAIMSLFFVNAVIGAPVEVERHERSEHPERSERSERPGMPHLEISPDGKTLALENDQIKVTIEINPHLYDN